MTPSQLIEAIAFAIANRFPLLIKGKPGGGKSDLVEEGRILANNGIEIFHPVVSDPTDFKGLPYQLNGHADFLPFAGLKRLVETKDPLVAFFDDLGQAPAAVQAAVMQLLLARQVNGHKISDNVTFIAATNRKEDKAAVSGLLEPVKSRFISILELEVNTDDWIKWALSHGMPIELMAFIRFRPELLDNFQPTKDIVNSPSPRTVASVGKMQNAGLPKHLEFEMIKGAAGEGFALEYTAFLELFRNMPNVDKIILDPTGTDVPKQAGILYGLSGALAHRMNDNNIDPIVTYLDRLPAEIAVCCMKDAVTRKPNLTNTMAFIKWTTGKVGNATV